MKELNTTISPHIFDKISKRLIMGFVILALLPTTGTGIYLFRAKALYIITLSIISAVLTQILMQVLLKREIRIDGSELVTGLLLGLSLPPTIPLWMPVIGAFFGISIVKWTFGGFGSTIFNPALAGRAFLSAAWPTLMTTWVMPDGITGATPLGILKTEGIKAVSYYKLFIGDIGGCIGETSALALLIGALFLLITKTIDWRIPIAYLGSLFGLTFVLGKEPIFHLLAGGVLLGAFFMATDYGTTPLTKKGRLIFGLGCGIFTAIIRIYSGLPEGVTYAILLMNGLTPLIDRFTKVKPFGFAEYLKKNF